MDGQGAPAQRLATQREGDEVATREAGDVCDEEAAVESVDHLVRVGAGAGAEAGVGAGAGTGAGAAAGAGAGAEGRRKEPSGW